MHPPLHPNQQREELQKKEQARREEQERRNLDAQLRAFDAHSFYNSLEKWGDTPLPRLIPQTVRLTPLRQKVIMYQPMPITRRGLSYLRRLSSNCSKLLSLLRAIDQRGMECPYIHQVNKPILERALEKCDQLQRARERYTKGRGAWARLGQLINKAHLVLIKRDTEYFKNRLEAVLMMCRHQEFAQDLMRLRRAVTHRTGSLLEPGEPPIPSTRGNATSQARQPQRGVPVWPSGRQSKNW